MADRVSIVRTILDNAPEHLWEPLVATAIIESNLTPTAVGDQGRSHGIFQEYDLGRGSGIPVAGRQDVAAATRRAAREFGVFHGRGARGPDLAFRAQRPADRGGYFRNYRNALPQARQLIRQARGQGSAPGRGGGGKRPPAGGTELVRGPSPGRRLTKKSERQLQQFVMRTEEQVRSGQSPDDPFNLLGSLTFRQIPGKLRRRRVRTRQEYQDDYAGATPLLAGGGDLHGHQEGKVDSGLALRGGQGGNWGGAMPRALELAKIAGVRPSSQKRSRRLTASGNVSDHYVGATTSYAVDLGTSGGANDAAFRRIAKALGVPNHPIGRPLNVTRNGYRYQVLWKSDSGHHDHIHIGVRRA